MRFLPGTLLGGTKPGKNTSASSRSQYPVTIWSLLKPKRVEDFRMTGSPELILNKSLAMEICRQRLTLTALPPNLQLIRNK